MGDTQTSSSPSSSGLSTTTSAAPLSRRAPRHWLEYAGVALAGLALIASSVAAGFSGWQAWILSDTAERQLRPYAYLGTNIDTDVKTNPDGSLVLTISPLLKVFGITPAAWMSPTWDVQILPDWTSGQFPDLPITAARVDLVAIPNQDYSMGSRKLTLQKADVDALNNKTRRLVLFGRVTYSDIFEKSRWSDFCTFFDWEEGAIKTVNICPVHNDADWSGRPPPMLARTFLQITVSPPTQKSR